MLTSPAVTEALQRAWLQRPQQPAKNAHEQQHKQHNAWLRKHTQPFVDWPDGYDQTLSEALQVGAAATTQRGHDQLGVCGRSRVHGL